jgi:hypothetical protein
LDNNQFITKKYFSGKEDNMRKFFSYILILALITIGCATPAGDKTKEAYIDQKAAMRNLTKGWGSGKIT